MKFSIPALACAALLASALAFAAGPTAQVSWTAPTQYTDGHAVAPTDIAFYTVLACETASPGTCLTFKAAPATAGTAPPLSLIAPVSCGNYNFTVTATTTATALYPNETSAPSNVVPYATGITCTPNPPGGVTVTPGATG